jgi:penicillin amidase
MPGDVPIRAHGNGRLPVPGWTNDYEWTGFIPFDELPYTLNPAEGYIATANNQVPPRDYKYLITTDWDYGFRANRIVSLITSAHSPIDIPYIKKMQGDMFDANGPVYVPLLTQLDLPASLPNRAAIMDELKNWDFQATANSSAAAVFETFWRHLLQDTFNDDLPQRYWPDGGARWNEVMRNLSADSPWWDDKTTPGVVETRAGILKKALTEAVNELSAHYGQDPAQWRWGQEHTATFRNQTLGESGVSLIEDLFNRGPFPTGGGEAIVDATGWSIIDGYEVNWLPSMRMIVDLSNLNQSVTVHTTGESGHAYNRHYIDMAPLWANVQYYPMWWDPASVVHDAEGHLLLAP